MALVKATQNSDWWNYTRTELREIASVFGVVVRQGREKANFVACLVAAGVATSDLAMTCSVAA
jgi:hypothetical protein